MLATRNHVSEGSNRTESHTSRRSPAGPAPGASGLENVQLQWGQSAVSPQWSDVVRLPPEVPPEVPPEAPPEVPPEVPPGVPSGAVSWSVSLSTDARGRCAALSQCVRLQTNSPN